VEDFFQHHQCIDNIHCCIPGHQSQSEEAVLHLTKNINEHGRQIVVTAEISAASQEVNQSQFEALMMSQFYSTDIYLRDVI